MLSGLGSMEVIEGRGLTGNGFGLEWDHLGSFRFLCVRYLYVDPVFRGVPQFWIKAKSAWNLVMVGCRGLGCRL